MITWRGSQQPAKQHRLSGRHFDLHNVLLGGGLPSVLCPSLPLGRNWHTQRAGCQRPPCASVPTFWVRWHTFNSLPYRHLDGRVPLCHYISTACPPAPKGRQTTPNHAPGSQTTQTAPKRRQRHPTAQQQGSAEVWASCTNKEERGRDNPAEVRPHSFTRLRGVGRIGTQDA
jgi:hypothetical protein